MTFDPGGPDGSGPPLQKEEGDVRSTKEYIISSSSACGLHRVRANCEGSSQVFHERARSEASLPLASPLCPRREWRVRARRRNEFEASDSRCLTAGDPFYRDVVPPAAAGICLLPSLSSSPPVTSSSSSFCYRRWTLALPSLLPLSPLPLPLVPSNRATRVARRGGPVPVAPWNLAPAEVSPEKSAEETPGRARLDVSGIPDEREKRREGRNRTGGQVGRVCHGRTHFSEGEARLRRRG